MTDSLTFSQHPVTEKIANRLLSVKRCRAGGGCATIGKYFEGGERVLFLNIIAGILLGIWLVLVLLGKGGFVHILLLNGIGIAVVGIVTTYRSRVRIRN